MGSSFLLFFVMVISHRGEHLSHPENTLPAFQAAIDAGADYFELDVRTTSDGHLMLMHDRTVDRTTNGKGRIKDMTFDQVRSLDAGSKFDPKFTGTKVPTFDEALKLARGKIRVYVDSKDVAPQALVAALEKADMLDKVVVYGGPCFLKKVQELRPLLKVMPEADNAETLEKLVSGLHPSVVAFDEGDFKDDVVGIARKAHADIFVDRLWKQDQLSNWQDAVERGATGVQTDHPAELVEYLRSRGLHK